MHMYNRYIVYITYTYYNIHTESSTYTVQVVNINKQYSNYIQDLLRFLFEATPTSSTAVLCHITFVSTTTLTFLFGVPLLFTATIGTTPTPILFQVAPIRFVTLPLAL